MATSPLIPLLDAPLFTPSTEQDQFTRIVSDNLGNLAGPADGFDEEILQLAALADAAASVVPSIDPDLTDAEAVVPAFDIDEETPLAADLALAIADGDAVLGAFDGDLLPPPAPTPTPITPPSGRTTPPLPTPILPREPPDPNAPLICITDTGEIGGLIGGICVKLPSGL